jgi:uncharacterized phiE125 gp8 family phage protein
VYAAAERLERDIDRQLITASYVYSAECFGEYVRLPTGPVTSITSISYIDQDGVSQTLNPSEYRFDMASSRVYPAVNGEFPSVLANEPLAVTIEHRVGYGTEYTNMPRLIRTALMLTIGKWFYDPAQEASLLHSQEMAYQRVVTMLRRSMYP